MFVKQSDVIYAIKKKIEKWQQSLQEHKKNKTATKCVINAHTTVIEELTELCYELTNRHPEA